MEQNAFEESQDLGVLSKGTNDDDEEVGDQERGSPNQKSKIERRPTSPSSGMDRRKDSSPPSDSSTIPQAFQPETYRELYRKLHSKTKAKTPVDPNDPEVEDRPPLAADLKRFIDEERRQNEQLEHEKGHQKRRPSSEKPRAEHPERTMFQSQHSCFEDLEEYSREGSRLSENDAREVAFQVLESLAAKHSEGNYHNSVRPWVR